MREGEEGEGDPEIEKEVVVECGTVGAGVGGQEPWAGGGRLVGPKVRDAKEGHTWRISLPEADDLSAIVLAFRRRRHTGICRGPQGRRPGAGR